MSSIFKWWYIIYNDTGFLFSEFGYPTNSKSGRTKEKRKHHRRTLAVMGSSLTATRHSHITVTRSPTATITQMAASSLCGLRSAPCTVHPSQGTFADAGCPASQGGLLSPVRNLGVKSPDILEGLFEKSFCSTKLVPQFLSS